MTIETAQAELLTLAAAMRGEEWSDDLAGALRAAANDGWDFRAAYREAFRLLLDDDGHPQEIRDKILRGRGIPPAADTGSGPVADTIAWAKQRAAEAAEAGRAAKRAGAA